MTNTNIVMIALAPLPMYRIYIYKHGAERALETKA